MEGLLFLLVAKIVLVDLEESLTVCQVKFDVTQCIIRYYPTINLTELSLMILESNWFQHKSLHVSIFSLVNILSFCGDERCLVCVMFHLL